MRFIVCFLFVLVLLAANAVASDCGAMSDGQRYYDQLEFEQAFPIFECNAQDGDKDAQYYTGVMYRFGLGVEPDYQKAIHWLKAASDQGHMAARFGLAHSYQVGLDETMSPNDAMAESSRLFAECDQEAKRQGVNSNVYASEYLGSVVGIIQKKVMPEINMGLQALKGGSGDKELALGHFHKAEKALASLVNAGPPISQSANGLLSHLHFQYFKYKLDPLYPDLYKKSERVMKNRSKPFGLN